MPPKFTTRLLENKTVQARGLRIKTVEVINTKRNKTLKYNELQLITDSLLERMPENIKFCIRGLNPIGMITIKGFDTEMIEDDYYAGRVLEDAKFMEFRVLHVSFAIPI